MPKILIINGSLTMGGAEKLIYELAAFAQKNNIVPEVLILDSYEQQYYDQILKQNNVRVIRTRLQSIKHLRAPLKMFKSLYWSVKLRFFANKLYESVHVIGLYNIYRVKNSIRHKHRHLWHVTNAIQNEGGTYNFPENYFDDKQDTVVCVNTYQIDELKSSYAPEVLKCKIKLFRLFIND